MRSANLRSTLLAIVLATGAACQRTPGHSSGPELGSGGQSGATSSPSGGAPITTGGLPPTAGAAGASTANAGASGIAGGAGVPGGGASSGGTGGGAASGEGSGGQTAPVVQAAPGTKPALTAQTSFDGLAVGNPTDLSLAVGPSHIVQVVNWSMAVYSKTGVSMRGPISSNTPFAGAGGRCEASGNDSAADRGDVLVRYDQLAQRWIFLQPVLQAPYAMCFAVSDGADPLGTYHHYEFARPLFPDYPRLGVWPDGYYVGSSTGDDVVQKTVCVADRVRMLAGQPATEKCFTKEKVNFLNPADVDGTTLPPAGAPNIVLALGGEQLSNSFEDDGVYAYKFHVDWTTPANSTFTGPTKIAVAAYHYLCNGQLSSCVTQPGTAMRLDAQGDKLMQRVSYRNFADHQALVVTHSINGANGGGGLRWYEFRINGSGDPVLHQQSTYSPDSSYRWLGSAAIDKNGAIGIGYSFGGAPQFVGQRFLARTAADPLGVLTFQESILVTGQAAQTDTLRWEDYTTTVVDPSDDQTFWYVGNYLKTGSSKPATRIGAYRVP